MTQTRNLATAVSRPVPNVADELDAWTALAERTDGNPVSRMPGHNLYADVRLPSDETDSSYNLSFWHGVAHRDTGKPHGVLMLSGALDDEAAAAVLHAIRTHVAAKVAAASRPLAA